MDEDLTSDLVIAEETPVNKSPEPKIFTDDNETEEINNCTNLIEKDNLTTTKMQTDQMQLKTNAGDSAGKSKPGDYLKRIRTEYFGKPLMN